MRKQKSKLEMVLHFEDMNWKAPDILAMDRAQRLYLGHCGHRRHEEMKDSEFKECTIPESLEWLLGVWDLREGFQDEMQLYFKALLEAFNNPHGLNESQLRTFYECERLLVNLVKRNAP